MRAIWASVSRGMTFSRIKAAALVFACTLTLSFVFPAANWVLNTIAVVSLGLVMSSFMFTQFVARGELPVDGKHFFRKYHCDHFKFMVIDEHGRVGLLGLLVAEEVRGRLMKKAEDHFGELWAPDAATYPQPK